MTLPANAHMKTTAPVLSSCSFTKNRRPAGQRLLLPASEASYAPMNVVASRTGTHPYLWGSAAMLAVCLALVFLPPAEIEARRSFTAPAA